MFGFGYAFPALAAGLLIAATGLYLWKRRRGGDAEFDNAQSTSGGDECDDEPIIALVLMLREPRYLDDRILRQIASEAFDIEFDETDADAEEFVVGESPAFIVKVAGHLFLVNNFSAPYADDVEEMAESIPDLRVRKAVSEHTAWLSVDLMVAPDEVDRKESYQYIGKLIAGLIDEDSLAIYATETGIVNVVDDELITGLGGPNTLEVIEELTNVPVVTISDDDPRMKAAVSEAKRRWPEFVEAFEHRRDEEIFGVKKAFTDGENTEFMWVLVAAIENDRIYGTLGNEPLNVRGVQEGDKVIVDLKDLNDWNYLRDGEIYGGFTTKAISDHLDELQSDGR